MLTTGHLQPAAQRLGDGLHRHALFVDRVVDCARFRLLKCQTVQPRHVGNMRRRPAIAAIADVGRNALLARHRSNVRHQPLLVGVVNLRQPHDGGVHAALPSTPSPPLPKPHAGSTMRSGRPPSMACRPHWPRSPCPRSRRTAGPSPAAPRPSPRSPCGRPRQFFSNCEKSWLKAR